MKTINFCFRIHQRPNLKRYRFFEIGNDHYYYDDYVNEVSTRQFADTVYLEANKVLLEIINNSNNKFRVSFVISGLALEQFERYAPDVIDSFRLLAETGCVEFVATPYAHSLASLYSADEFKIQLRAHSDKMFEIFGIRPTTLANTALIYSDEIAAMALDAGYKTILIEGAKHILGWKSPHYVYGSVVSSKLKLLVRDNKLSDDISYRFSQWNWNEYPLTAEKFVSWINKSPAEEEVFNFFMGYEALGMLNTRQSGIFEFFKALPFYAMESGIGFSTPSLVASKAKAVDSLSVVYPISWADEEKDLSSWCGNELQNEALNKLYGLAERVNLCSDIMIKLDWLALQDATNFSFMTTKHYSDGQKEIKNNPYDSPYDAFMNYMNVLSDYIERVNALFPSNVDNEELNSLLKTIYNQEQELVRLRNELKAKTAKTTKAAASKKN